MQNQIRITLAAFFLVSAASYGVADDSDRRSHARANPQEAAESFSALVGTPAVASEARQAGSVSPRPERTQGVATGVRNRVTADDSLAAQTSADALESKHEQNAAELRIAMLQEDREAAIQGEQTNPPGADASRVDILKQIDVVIAQQQSAESAREDYDAQVADLEAIRARLSGGDLDEQPPYSIVFFDRLKDAVQNTQIRIESAEASVTSARTAAESAKVAAEERSRMLRQRKEAVSSDTPDPKTQIAELEHKLAEEMVVLRRQELSIAEANLAIAKLNLEINRTKVAIVENRVVFTQETLDETLEDLRTRELELKQHTAGLQTELRFAERRWLAARQEADSIATAEPEMSERVDALRVAQMTIQHKLALTNQRLQRIPVVKNAWERRFLVINNRAQRKERSEWIQEAQNQIEQVAQDRRSRQLKLDELRVSQAAALAKIDAIKADQPQRKRWLQSKQNSIAEQVDCFNSSLLELDKTHRTLERLKTQIEGEPGRSIGELAEDTWTEAKRVWNFELASIDDTSLTVGKVCSSVLLLFVGFLFARWLSVSLGRRLPRWGVDEAASHAIESLTFYALLVTLGLTALRYANVPLTVFTFLGGAIAIGIGFGSQNILNNFISGLILLAERPIKVGDLVCLDGTHGNVTKIGARSTQIRTGDNQDIIVPNSKFLENNVTNLTRRDDRLRTSISIGVAYGSDLNAVLRLLARAASEQSGVLDRPKPMVWFNDFGDNALVFQVHFWVQAKNLTQVRMIETGVRLKIDAYFREAEIVIAFPQRDLHLHSARPIDFRLIAEDPDAEKLPHAA